MVGGTTPFCEQHRSDGFDAPATAQQAAGHRLGGAHRDGLRPLAQGPLMRGFVASLAALVPWALT